MENLFYYRHNQKKSQGAILRHYMNYHEITAVFDGILRYAVDGKDYILGKGDIIYVRKGASRERSPIENADYVSLNFYSDKTYDFPIVFEDGLTEIVRPMLRTMDAIHEYTNNLEDERYCLLLRCIIKQLETQLRVNNEHPLAFQIKSYIKKNLSQKITLASISENTFSSPIHCENVFKKETGYSIIDYVINERIRMAKTLLSEGSLSLTKISELVGFSDYNYFSRVFKKRTGLSPKEYSTKAFNDNAFIYMNK